MIIVQDRGILYHLANTGPHPKPIIGCDCFYTPDAERHMLHRGVWLMGLPCDLDELGDLTELAASVQILQRHVRLSFPIRPLLRKERTWSGLKTYLHRRIDEDRRYFQRLETNQRERPLQATTIEPGLIEAFEAYRQKTLGTLLELSLLADEVQRRPSLQSVIPTLNLYKLGLSTPTKGDDFAWIDSVTEGALRLTYVEWGEWRIKSQEVVCEGTATEILDHIEQMIAQQEEGAAAQSEASDEQ